MASSNLAMCSDFAGRRRRLSVDRRPEPRFIQIIVDVARVYRFVYAVVLQKREIIKSTVYIFTILKIQYKVVALAASNRSP